MADYRVDDLARAAGTTVRNVRAYQDRGLLPSPRREGRVAWYSDTHLERLRTITDLLGRGYTLASIGELLAAQAEGLGIDHLVGLGEAIAAPYRAEEPATYTLAELAELFGGDHEGLAAINRAVELDLLRPVEAGFVAPDPTVLRAGAQLVRSGVPIGAVVETFATVRDQLDGAAAQMVDLVATHVLEPALFDDDGQPLALSPASAAELADLVREIRPIAHTVVVAELGHALERAIADRVHARLAPMTGPNTPGRAEGATRTS